MLREKIAAARPGILTFGVTPPKASDPEEKALARARATLERVAPAKIDGFVIYDIQDESARTSAKRTFEYSGTRAPEDYWRNELGAAVPAVIYKVVGKYSEDDLRSFLTALPRECATVFVGAGSSREKVRMSLKDAYTLRKGFPDALLGGICIPERHRKKGDEEYRIAAKCLQGCRFFVTQAVYNTENAKRFLDDYAALNVPKVPVIFTFTPCGSARTLEFMRWLGISVVPEYEREIMASPDPLSRSIDLCTDLFEFLYKYGLSLGIPVGANVESISSRKVEQDGAAKLLLRIRRIIDSYTPDDGTFEPELSGSLASGIV
jgi:methylenetetrahydrofolate reductase (NADPH)